MADLLWEDADAASDSKPKLRIPTFNVPPGKPIKAGLLGRPIRVWTHYTTKTVPCTDGCRLCAEGNQRRAYWYMHAKLESGEVVLSLPDDAGLRLREQVKATWGGDYRGVVVELRRESSRRSPVLIRVENRHSGSLPPSMDILHYLRRLWGMAAHEDAGELPEGAVAGKVPFPAPSAAVESAPMRAAVPDEPASQNAQQLKKSLAKHLTPPADGIDRRSAKEIFKSAGIDLERKANP